MSDSIGMLLQSILAKSSFDGQGVALDGASGAGSSESLANSRGASLVNKVNGLIANTVANSEVKNLLSQHAGGRAGELFVDRMLPKMQNLPQSFVNIAGNAPANQSVGQSILDALLTVTNGSPRELLEQAGESVLSDFDQNVAERSPFSMSDVKKALSDLGLDLSQVQDAVLKALTSKESMGGAFDRVGRNMADSDFAVSMNDSRSTKQQLSDNASSVMQRMLAELTSGEAMMQASQGAGVNVNELGETLLDTQDDVGNTLVAGLNGMFTSLNSITLMTELILAMLYEANDQVKQDEYGEDITPNSIIDKLFQRSGQPSSFPDVSQNLSNFVLEELKGEGVIDARESSRIQNDPTFNDSMMDTLIDVIALMGNLAGVRNV